LSQGAGRRALRHTGLLMVRSSGHALGFAGSDYMIEEHIAGETVAEIARAFEARRFDRDARQAELLTGELAHRRDVVADQRR
jgi:hypothetical protein